MTMVMPPRGRDSHWPHRPQRDRCTQVRLLDSQTASWDWPLHVCQRASLLATKRQAAQQRTARESALGIAYTRSITLWWSRWMWRKCGGCSAVRRTHLCSWSCCPPILVPHMRVLSSAQRRPVGVHETRRPSDTLPNLLFGTPYGRRHYVQSRRWEGMRPRFVLLVVNTEAMPHRG